VTVKLLLCGSSAPRRPSANGAPCSSITMTGGRSTTWKPAQRFSVGFQPGGQLLDLQALRGTTMQTAGRFMPT
jgi:hypothetical protein